MQELSQRLPWWIKLLHKTRLDSLVSLFRADTRHVPAEQRALNVEVLALGQSMLKLRRKGYDINKILKRGLLTVEDLNFNAILIRANTHLQEIAKTLRQDLPESLVERMSLAEQALEELWDPYSEQYYSRDHKTHKLLKEPSIATLLPLYAGSISQERAAKLVTKLENEHIFGTAFPVPSVPQDSSWFNPERYWQGPSWVNINWLIIDGLKRYGFDDHAAALRDSTLEMVNRSGFFEYFNPLTGAGLGAVNFSWTAALTIDLLKDK
jgi:glycogen debranching enzyme